MYPFRIFSLLIFFNIITVQISTAQFAESPFKAKTMVGLMYGYGTQQELGMVADYQYDVIYYQLQYHRILHNWHKTSLELLIQPQYNRTNFIYGDNEFHNSHGYEFGLNVGFLFRRYIAGESVSLYMLISTGPHYASSVPFRQSSGFMFSDNLFLGITFKLDDNIYLDLRPGIRHLSNAGFKRPNGGINNIVINGGLIVGLK
ncbi:MAG: acyloxyacyl hydrolase [Flavobacteriaceae bacterium]